MRKKTSEMLWMRWVSVVCLLLIVPLYLSAGEKKKRAEEQFSSLSFLVLRDGDGRPVKFASVVLHFLRKDGSEDNDGLQIKTDTKGRAAITDIPYGTLRVQVVAPRLQTYGADVEINQAEQEFVIRLKPPAAQISVDR